MRKFSSLLLLTFVILLFGNYYVLAAEPDKGGGAYTSLDQLEHARIGVMTGTTFDQIVLDRLPEAQISYYNSISDIITALTSHKIDAFPYDEPVLRTVMAENNKIGILPEYLDTFDYAYIFNKDKDGQELCDEMSDFIGDMKEDGILDGLYEKWLSGTAGSAQMPDLNELTGENGTLLMATEALNPPFAFIRNNEIVGYEIELAILFCREYGYKLKVQNMTFDGVLPSVISKKADFAGAGLSVTEERAQSVLFSESYFSGGTTLAILKEGQASGFEEDQKSAQTAQATPEFTEFSQLSGKTVSMLTGAPFEELVKSKVPDVGEFTYYNNMADILLALDSKKTDAVLSNNAVSQLAVNRNPTMALFPESLKDGVFGIAFAKGDPSVTKWQEAFDSISDEERNAAWEKWTGGDDSLKILPAQDWPGSNGTVTVAACDTLEPMSYAGEGGEIKGFDIEMILLMAKKLDVHVDFVGMEFSAVMSYVQTGKALMGVGSIIVTDERKEACDFIEYYPAAFVLVVRAVTEEAADSSFFAKVKESFEKTFIREDRWQLFIYGILTTLVITFMAVLLGTILGFLIFMTCRNGNLFANTITRFFLWIVQGMPMVVLLMVLYYVVFGKVSINGILVAVIGFTITFCAAVFGLLRMGVGAVDHGQYEAGYALGYTRNRTFFRFILPQALPHILPAYKGEIVSLIKSTAIVGYIAVQDLTKVGDIIRSRTYEAFFPLIAVTIIYFVLEELVRFFINRIEIKLKF